MSNLSALVGTNGDPRKEGLPLLVLDPVHSTQQLLFVLLILNLIFKAVLGLQKEILQLITMLD